MRRCRSLGLVVLPFANPLRVLVPRVRGLRVYLLIECRLVADFRLLRSRLVRARTVW